jgi:hypothetical protein
MSLETALAETNAAIKDLIATLKADTALRQEAVNKLTAATNGKEKKAAADPKPNISASPEDRKDPSDDDAGKTADPREGLKELVAKYIGGTDREEERAARKEKIKKLLNHEAIKKPDVETAKGADDIKDASIDLFVKNVNGLIKQGDLTAPKQTEDALV